MENRARCKQNSGFTLVEVLATVAIMIILLSVSAVSIGQSMDTMKLTELDNAAWSIYMAAQNRAVRLSNAKRLSSLVGPSAGIGKELAGTNNWHTDVTKTLYYVSYAGGGSLGELLADGDIDSALTEGWFYIVYDLDSGGVTDVFYAEDDISGLFESADIKGYATDRSARLLKEFQVGYYSGGEAAEAAVGGYYPPDTSVKPYLDVTIENTEKLTVTVTVKGEYAKFYDGGDPDISNLTVRLGQDVETLNDENSIDLLTFGLPNMIKKEKEFEESSPDTNYYAYTWVLDSLTGADKQFKDLVGNKVVPGQDFKVTAAITHGGEEISDSDINNSLFAYIPNQSGNDTAYIKNLRHLQNLNTEHSETTINKAVQVADVVPSVEYAGYYFKPIGSSTSAFTGTYDGKGYTISGLKISGGDYQGLFGYVSGGSTVENVTVVKGEVIGNGNYVGGIVGFNLGMVKNCTYGGIVSGSSNVGGIVGANGDTSIAGGTIERCNNSAKITGSYSVPGNDVALGGIAGRNNGSVKECENTGSVNYIDNGESNSVGGIVGLNNDSGTVTNCYNTNAVKGYGNVGGVVGWSVKELTVTNCYNIGKVGGSSGVGGVVGLGTAGNCFYLEGCVTGGNTVDGATSITELAFGTPGTFGSTWNVNGSTDSIWVMGYNEHPGDEDVCPARPILRGNQENDMEAVDEEDYGAILIGSAGALEQFSSEVNNNISTYKSGKIKLTADITLEGEWTPIGDNETKNTSSRFTGTFDGGEHTISELYVNKEGSDYQGLFGVVQGGTVKNLTVKGTVKGGTNVAGIVGWSYNGIVENCHSYVEVSGTKYVGGIVGQNNTASCTVSNCTNNGPVKGTNERIGGIVGFNKGIVQNCGNINVVDGATYVGGITGFSQESVSGCYNVGDVSGTSTYVGGVVGRNYNSSATATDCYNTGTVTSNGTNVGGVIGNNDGGTAKNCYNVGGVSGGATVGGVVGYNTGTVANCYYGGDCTTRGIQNVDREGQATKLETFDDQTAFTPGPEGSNWDFENIWEMSEAHGRPILKDNPEPAPAPEP